MQTIRRGASVFTLLYLPILLSPILILFAEAFHRKFFLAGENGPSLSFFSERHIGLMENSLLLATGAGCLSVLIGVSVAFLVERTDIPYKWLIRFNYYLPLLMPPFIHAIVWTDLTEGLRAALNATGTANPWLPDIYSRIGGVFVFTLSFFPFVALITASGLRSIDKRLEEAALTVKSRWATLTRITLPLIAPHILFSGTLVFVLTLVNFEVADILRLTVYPVEIFIHFSAYYDDAAATLLSIPLITISITLLGASFLYIKKKGHDILELSERDNASFALGPMRMPAVFYSISILCLSVIVPLAVLLHGAGDLANYRRVLNEAGGEVWYSLWISGLSALLMTGCCFWIAYYIERSRSIYKHVIDFLTQIPIGLPSIVLGIGVIKLYNRDWLDIVYESHLLLILGLLSAYSPFVIRILAAAIKQIPKDLEEAGQMARRGAVRSLFSIVIPLSSPGLAAAFGAAFVLCIGNLGLSLLVVAPGKATVPITIYNYLHYGAKEAVFALCVTLIFAVLLLLAVLWQCHRVFAIRVRK